MRLWLLVLLAASGPGCKKSGRDAPRPSEPAPAASPTITHGVSAGAVTQRSALLWARASGEATLRAEVTTSGAPAATGQVAVTAETDFAGVIAIDGLEAGTSYEYTISAGGSSAGRGAFKTAPDPATAAAVRFGWSGDLAGQNACRDAERGFPIFEPLNAAGLDFFIALGDMIYADNLCTAKGMFGNAQIPGDYPIARDMPGFWAHWKYNREDPGYRELLASMAVYPTWDDHEVINDSGRETALLPLGLAAFRHYNPVVARPGPIHSRVRWGKHLELFFLDNRSYRDANNTQDTDEKPKTMLGAEQRRWLEEGLRDSDATWLVVVSSVPISIPTGSEDPIARDGWADFGSGQGFERELDAILDAATAKRVPKMLWITTDVHFASVFRYRPKGSALRFHEAVVGPLSAGLYPTRDFDDSFGTERLFFHGPESPESLTYEQSLTYMSFGQIEIDPAGALTLRIVNGAGVELYSLAL